MPDLPIESPRFPMTATGIVNAAMEWSEKDAQGKRHKTDRQDRNPDTGMPLWDVEVFYVGTNFGQDSTITANVTVGAADKPSPAPLTPISFTGLAVSMWPNKSKGLSERWSAEAVADMQERSPKANGSTPDSASSASTSSSSSSSGSSASSSKSASAA